VIVNSSSNPAAALTRFGGRAISSSLICGTVDAARNDPA
jgi:hypothetical protein